MLVNVIGMLPDGSFVVTSSTIPPWLSFATLFLFLYACVKLLAINALKCSRQNWYICCSLVLMGLHPESLLMQLSTAVHN